MPKRLKPEELDAALAAGQPPNSDEYPDDDNDWHQAQNDWLERWLAGWQSGAVGAFPLQRRRKDELSGTS